MRFELTNGRTVTQNVRKYYIDWDEPVTRGKKNKFGKRQWEVKQLLKEEWEKYIVLEEFKLPKDRKSIDFLCLTTRQAVEVDGEAHLGYHNFFHNSRLDFFNQKKNDFLKEEFCKVNDITLYRIFPSDELTVENFKKKGIFK